MDKDLLREDCLPGPSTLGEAGGGRGRGRKGSRPLEGEDKGQDGVGGGGEEERERRGGGGTPRPPMWEASMSSGRSTGPSLDPRGFTSLGSSQ